MKSEFASSVLIPTLPPFVVKVVPPTPARNPPVDVVTPVTFKRPKVPTSVREELVTADPTVVLERTSVPSIL